MGSEAVQRTRRDELRPGKAGEEVAGDHLARQLHHPQRLEQMRPALPLVRRAARRRFPIDDFPADEAVAVEQRPNTLLSVLQPF